MFKLDSFEFLRDFGDMFSQPVSLRTRRNPAKPEQHLTYGSWAGFILSLGTISIMVSYLSVLILKMVHYRDDTKDS